MCFMGIKHVILVVNKMDLVDYDKHIFDEITREFKMLCSEFDFISVYTLPASATVGDNITTASSNTPWYTGSSLLEYLETIQIADTHGQDGFLMPVQRICRPDRNFRGIQGEIALGKIAVGDEIVILPAGESSRVAQILVTDSKQSSAAAGQPVTICLEDEVDVSRGCVLAKNYQPETANLFSATIIWTDNDKLVAGRSYQLKCGTSLLPAKILKVKYKIDINDGKHLEAEFINKNEIAVVDIILPSKIVFDVFSHCKSIGGFILIDRITHMTSACGIIEHGLRRSSNVFWQETEINREFRSSQKGQTPFTLWFTGLSGSGKSTLANALEVRLVSMNKHTMILDGDNVRQGLNNDLGFTETERVENIRRIAEVSKLMNDAGLIVLTAFISPYRQDRDNSRTIIGQDYIEVYVSTSLEECEKRDVKGLYRKARNNEIPNFTGISSAYEEPKNPDIVIDTEQLSVEKSVDMILTYLQQSGYNL